MLQIQLIGNLGNPPEMRYMPDGQPMTSFSVACNNRRSPDGQESPPTWIQISAWGKLADHTNEYLDTGSRVFVQGRLRISDYTNRNGEKKYSIEVTADKVEFLSNRKDAGDDHQVLAPAGQKEALPDVNG